MQLSQDPIINAIYGQIKRGIEVCLKNGCYGSALVLIYSRINAMANLSRPANQKNVTPKDFIDWVNSYIRFDSDVRIMGEELYAARCAIIHKYGVESEKARLGRVRTVLYMVGGKNPIKYKASFNKDYIMVEINALASTFFPV